MDVSCRYKIWSMATRAFIPTVCIPVICGLILLPFSVQVAAGAKDLPMSVRRDVDAAIGRVKPALARIRVVSTYYQEGREVKMQSVGSGAIITREGHLITNHHVAGHATRIFCTLSDREEIEAELVGTDAPTDISVIRLKPDQPREFPVSTFGDSSKIRVGDPVLAMGSPMALSQSVTLGMISNVEMIMPKFFGPLARFKLDGEDVGLLVRWIGHDAAIYGGNSGGPLVNLRGQIIGINEISMGLAGAIPGNLAKSVAEQIIATGKVRRSWLGIEVQPLFKNSPDTRGVLVSGVVPDSPAAQAGLLSGDRLLRLGNKATDVRYDEQMPDFMRLVTGLAIGKEVTAMVLRDGRETTVRLTPTEREEVQPKQREIKQWGLTVRNISFFVAKEMKRKNQDGVLVTSVRPGGPAGEAKPGLSPKDVLVEINGTPVRNVRDLIDTTRKLTEGKTEPVPVVAAFERGLRRYLTIVKVGIQELSDPGLEVSKAWLPIETQVISRDIAKQLGRPELKGFAVTQVYAGSTAEKAGLRSGDFVVAVDGEKLTASAPEDYEELSTLIRQYDIGATVKLTVFRDQTKSVVPVELTRSPKLEREMKKYRNDDFEFTARDITFFDRAEEQWKEEQTGALVEEVKSGSWAELGALYADDLIVAIDTQPVRDVDSLKGLMERIAADKKKFVVMKVLRGIHTRYLELEPDWKERNP